MPLIFWSLVNLNGTVKRLLSKKIIKHIKNLILLKISYRKRETDSINENFYALKLSGKFMNLSLLSFRIVRMLQSMTIFGKK